MQLETLYREHFSDILRYLKRFLSDSMAEDLAQEVFVKAGKGLANFRGEASPKTWLYRIAANTLRDFLKSKSHREDEARNLISERELEEYEGSTHGQASAEENLMRDEMNACIREFIHRLPQNYSSVLVLSDLEGHSNQEVAEILGVTLETVKIRLHRARARLRVELSQGCDISTTRDNELECRRKEE